MSILLSWKEKKKENTQNRLEITVVDFMAYWPEAEIEAFVLYFAIIVSWKRKRKLMFMTAMVTERSVMNLSQIWDDDKKLIVFPKSAGVGSWF